jgi:hypothetical protein
MRLFVPVFLAISSAAIPISARAETVPVTSRDGASVTGLYRLTITGKNRKPKTVHLMVREGETGTSAALMDRGLELELTNVRMDGTVLKGSVMTSEGLADLELKLGGGLARGTLTIDDMLLSIEGDRDN